MGVVGLVGALRMAPGLVPWEQRGCLPSFHEPGTLNFSRNLEEKTSNFNSEPVGVTRVSCCLRSKTHAILVLFKV